ncbi:acetylcholinesterase-1-like [Dermatophagoides farinae]|uniref:acetylcholinesterase-1-like n=1 Tax=Dermatophagoides farinae TaxID=6954 RepID=UPI003F6436B7
MNRFAFIFALILNICFISSFGAGEEYAPIVDIRHGKIRGIVRTIGDKKVYLYQGFRFGEAKRFEKPTMVTSWPGDIYNATKVGNSCVQFMNQFVLENVTNESEDCLFLNVYKPVTNNGKLLPVMVWIYGGGFQGGSIFLSFYDSTYLASYGEVIVVAINYRIGPFGFLYGDNEHTPGNLGFHDQLLGLKWVQENIENFGGDPNKVTIFGESAGSMSASALVQSPIARGLFHRAIMQSGSLYLSYPFLRDNKQMALRKTKKLCEKLDCKNENIEQALACLKTKSTEEIKNAALGDGKEMMANELFQPIIGDDVLPYDVVHFKKNSNHVDLLFGATHDEGSMMVLIYFPELMDDKTILTLKQVHEKILSMTRQMNMTKSNEIINYYTNNLNVSNVNEVRIMFGNLFSDLSLLCPTMLFGQRIARMSDIKNNFYSYRLDRRGIAAVKMGCSFEWMGVCHGADIPYVFHSSSLKDSPEDVKLSNDMIRAWTNFAKTGHPGKIGSIEWRQVYENGEKSSATTMLLNVEYKMADDVFKDSCDGLWEKIFEFYN